MLFVKMEVLDWCAVGARLVPIVRNLSPPFIHISFFKTNSYFVTHYSNRYLVTHFSPKRPTLSDVYCKYRTIYELDNGQDVSGQVHYRTEIPLMALFFPWSLIPTSVIRSSQPLHLLYCFFFLQFI